MSASQTDTFRLASYNVCNLFGSTHHHAKKNREIRALAEVLGMLQADCVCIQEVESTAALAAVNERLKNPYTFSQVFTGNYYRGLHLGVMARSTDFDVAVESHAATPLTDENGESLSDYANPHDAALEKLSPLKIQRDILQIEIASSRGVELTVFNVHLKSHSYAEWRLLENDTIRAAEIDALIQTVKTYTRKFPARPVCIAGDLNETDNRPLLKRLVTDLNLCDVLEQDWVRTANTPSYSYQKYPSRARLDYLLLNPAANSIYVQNSACIHGSPSGRVASDHYPVSAEFAFPET